MKRSHPRAQHTRWRHGSLCWLVIAACILLGAGLRIEALDSGFYSDDFEQLAMLDGQFVLKRAGWDLFWFGARTQAEHAALLDFGFHPWWTAPDHKLAMFRPLSSALLWLDAHTFGHDAWWFHLHSLLWWCALIALTGLFLFRVLPAAPATLALLLFTLDEAHNVPFAWIANRNTLVSAAFGMLALLAHVTARERGRVAMVALAALGWTLALAGGEYAFGFVAYALGYELLRPQCATQLRAVSAAALAVPLSVYLVTRSALGYGVIGSGLYVGPNELLRFLTYLPGRALALSSELWLSVPSAWWLAGSPWRSFMLGLQWFTPEQWLRLPGWPAFQAGFGLLALGAGALCLRFIHRKRSPELEIVRYALLGSALSLVAVAGAVPGARLLAAPALGVHIALAVLSVQLYHALRAGEPRRFALGSVLAAIAVLHLAIPARAAYATGATRGLRARASEHWSLAAEIPRHAEHTDVVVISTVDFTTEATLPWIRLQHGLGLPRSYRRLCSTPLPIMLSRVDANTLALQILAAQQGGSVAGSLNRPRERPLRAGDHVALRGMDISVLAVRHGDPVSFAVHFDRPLEDASLLFLQARPDGLRRFIPPPIGQSLLMPLAGHP